MEVCCSLGGVGTAGPLEGLLEGLEGLEGLKGFFAEHHTYVWWTIERATLCLTIVYNTPRPSSNVTILNVPGKNAISPGDHDEAEKSSS